MSRSELREIIIKVLYQVYIYQDKNLSFDLNTIIKEQIKQEKEFVKDTLNGIIKNQEQISSLANKHMKDWNIDRISKVDKAILSLAIYELLYTETPEVVAINEAIELSKKYSDEKVVKLINGVLDSIMHKEVNNG
ncbi:MAG: transcription antitermination factor NusB [Bacilli bacterium]